MPKKSDGRKAAGKIIQVVAASEFAKQTEKMLRELLTIKDQQRYAKIIENYTNELHSLFNNMGVHMCEDVAGGKRLLEVITEQMQKGIKRSQTGIALALAELDIQNLGGYDCDGDCLNCEKLQQALR